ncbi:MAG: AgmX/PglI C-terminal domain-containing protein [Bdellovibrionota bacterium]
MKTPVILRVFKGNQLKEVKQFDLDQIVIGHEADVQLDLDDEAISPIHCLIELRDNGYYICDLGSKTGTYKNGAQILDEPLHSGDEVVLGPFKLSFFVGVPKPKAGPQVVSQVAAQLPKEKVVEKPIEKVLVKNVEKPAAAKSPVEKTSAVPTAEKKFPLQKPEIKSHFKVAPSGKKKKRVSFAPLSEVKDLKDVLRPTKGSVLEVIVAWRERVLTTYHFKNKGAIRVGNTKNEQISLPTKEIPRGWPLIELGSTAKINIRSEMKVELQNSQGTQNIESLIAIGKCTNGNQGQQIRLDQGELLKLSLGDGNINLFFRYVPQSPAVPVSPFFFSSSELAGVVLSVIIAGVLAFYISIMRPPTEELEQEEITRTAEVIFNKPLPTERTPRPPPENVPPPPPKIPEKAKVDDQKRESQVKGLPTDKKKAQTANQAARANEVAPIPNSQNRTKKFTSTKQGGAVKLGKEAGANAQSAQPKDVSKIGLFGAFGGGGIRSKLDQAYQGAGGILGQAEKATGSSGFSENRDGDDVGSKFKDTGAGGKGTATQGISGIGTKGRSSGMSAYGSTDGFGDKTSVAIEAGGADESFVGSIDREAVRRRIRHNLNFIRGCYESELRKLDQAGRKAFEGRVTLEWKIVENGVAKDVIVKSSTLKNSAIEKCVSLRMAAIIFPDPPKGMEATVTYPFFFRAGQ